MDEKTDLVVQFLNRCFWQSPAGFSSMILRMWEALEQEPMLAATSEDQRQEARKAVERAIFSEVKVNQGNCEHIFLLLMFADLHGSSVPQHWGRCIEGFGSATAHWQALWGGQSQPQGPQDSKEISVRVPLAGCTGLNFSLKFWNKASDLWIHLRLSWEDWQPLNFLQTKCIVYPGELSSILHISRWRKNIFYLKGVGDHHEPVEPGPGQGSPCCGWLCPSSCICKFSFNQSRSSLEPLRWLSRRTLPLCSPRCSLLTTSTGKSMRKGRDISSNLVTPPTNLITGTDYVGRSATGGCSLLGLLSL